ncbi:hypothetical protein HMPREF1545_02936 [Oscillibacter sp. KLE 1728]|nr:hypothetical protein HMPREF1545_02936 [Oscillibacter sp. KLE 1728]ERK66464.1 hypothetical protein HMPREF1546_00803 [Oscillibacter sp. KLE 1745]
MCNASIFSQKPCKIPGFVRICPSSPAAPHLLLRRACLSAIMTKIPFSVYIKTRQIRKEHMDGH